MLAIRFRLKEKYDRLMEVFHYYDVFLPDPVRPASPSKSISLSDSGPEPFPLTDLSAEMRTPD